MLTRDGGAQGVSHEWPVVASGGNAAPQLAEGLDSRFAANLPAIFCLT